MKKTYRPAATEKLRDKSLSVKAPSHETEFEVQAYLWCQLRALGYNARGEVKTTFAGRAVVRFDIAIFNGENLAAIVECKHERKQLNSDWSSTRQGERYAQFGVPVYLVRGMKEAQELLIKAEEKRLF